MSHFSQRSHQEEVIQYMFEKYPDVVNVPQMCEMLGGISIKTGYRLLQTNKVNHFRIGRTYKIPKSSIIQYLRSMLMQPTTPHCDALMH